MALIQVILPRPHIQCADRVSLCLCVRLQRHERAGADKVAPCQGDVEPGGAVVPAQAAAVVALCGCVYVCV